MKSAFGTSSQQLYSAAVWNNGRQVG